MTDGYGQYFGWDTQPTSFEYPATLATKGTNDYQMNSQSMSPNPQFWTNYTPSQYVCSPSSQNTGIGTTSEPSGSQLSPPVANSVSQVPAPATSVRDQQTRRRRLDETSRSPPAVDKSERRRQQNRTSQLAFRQRSKMTLMALQEELDQSLLVNETLYGTIEALLDKTEDLKRSIEDVLASRLKRGRSESYNSPLSSYSLPLYPRGKRR
ncbi:hypothetical protein N431DRAFT_489224 [Stipitochalara longipes BDJ]|nr:hypothetical protein N431DRAFT_489224 [Stipitochalara longipes BDJ]